MGVELAEFNGENIHVRLLMNFPPKAALSRLLNSCKGVSFRRLRQSFPGLVRHCCRANKLWSGSYLADSAGGAPLSIVRRYIEQRNPPLQPPGQNTSQNRFTPGRKAGALRCIPVAWDGQGQVRGPAAGSQSPGALFGFGSAGLSPAACAGADRGIPLGVAAVAGVRCG
ncbi:IS200/IS605 family transposase [Streptomyces sp. NPDC102279]|uniref:IS200/IS605 family transposase n=1 Tax=Streptomyces sp. NPDC102279 TaxID=3366153 RepID=UPI00380B3C72